MQPRSFSNQYFNSLNHKVLGGEGEVEKERDVNPFEQFCQKILHPLLKTKALREVLYESQTGKKIEKGDF